MDLQYAKFDYSTEPKTLLNYDEVFTTEKSLGRGASGVVRLIRSRHSGILYALKLLDNNPTKEVKLLERVSKYPHCYRYISCYYDNFKVEWHKQILYAILMEYIEGTDLEQIKKFERLKKKNLTPFTVDEIYHIADYIFAILSYLHKLGISHGDVSFKNMILTPDGTIKFIDFGLGCLINDRCQLTDYDIDKGLEYHFNDIEPDDNLPLYFKTKDVHNASLLLYELITGQRPYQYHDNGLTLIEPNIQTTNQRLNRVVNGTGVMDPFTRLTAEEALAELHR